MANGYPKSFLDSCIHKFMFKVMTNEEKLPSFGPDKKKVIISLPYCGVNSDKLKRQLGRMFTRICPWIDLTVIFKPVCKLACLSRLKCFVPKLSQSNLVYKIDCKDCEQFYIGMTTRRLEQRLSEHSSKDTNSALFCPPLPVEAGDIDLAWVVSQNVCPILSDVCPEHLTPGVRCVSGAR